MVIIGHDQESFLQMEPQERKRREIADLVYASDDVRQRIRNRAFDLPNGKLAPSEQVFWQIHNLHAGKNFYRAINVDHSGQQISENVQTLANYFSESESTDQVGRLRTVSTSVDGFLNVHVESLPALERAFFAAIDKLLQLSNLTELPLETKLQFLARVEVIQTICHFPVDLSGRTIEDFMVYIADRMGVQLTFSESGFRGFIKGETIEEADRWRDRLRRATLQEITASAVDLFPDIPEEAARQFVHGLYNKNTQSPLESTQEAAEFLSEFALDTGVYNSTQQLEVVDTSYYLLRHELSRLTTKLIGAFFLQTEGSLWEVFHEQLDEFVETLEKGTRTTYHEDPHYGLAYVMKHLSMAQGSIFKSDYTEAWTEVEKAAQLLRKVTVKVEKRQQADRQTVDQTWFLTHFSKKVQAVYRLLKQYEHKKEKVVTES